MRGVGPFFLEGPGPPTHTPAASTGGARGGGTRSDSQRVAAADRPAPLAPGRRHDTGGGIGGGDGAGAAARPAGHHRRRSGGSDGSGGSGDDDGSGGGLTPFWYVVPGQEAWILSQRALEDRGFGIVLLPGGSHITTPTGGTAELIDTPLGKALPGRLSERGIFVAGAARGVAGGPNSLLVDTCATVCVAGAGAPAALSDVDATRSCLVGVGGGAVASSGVGRLHIRFPGSHRPPELHPPRAPMGTLAAGPARAVCAVALPSPVPPPDLSWLREFEENDEASGHLGDGAAPRQLGTRIRGRLRERLDVWRQHTSDAFILSVIEKDLELPLVDGIWPKRFACARNFIDPGDMDWTRRAVAELVEHGAVQRWDDVRDELAAAGIRAGPTPHLVMPLIVAEKPSSTPTERKLRLIHDCRYLNKLLHRWPFVMEQLGDFVKQLERDDMVITLDLSSAYHHAGIALRHRTLLGFELDGVLYVYALGHERLRLLRLLRRRREWASLSERPGVGRLVLLRRLPSQPRAPRHDRWGC